MKHKSLLIYSIPLLLGTLAMAGCSGIKNNSSGSDSGSSYSPTGSTTDIVTTDSDMFGNADEKILSDSDVDATITLNGSIGTLSDESYGSSGSTVVINTKGVFKVSGSSNGVTIKIEDTAKSGKIYLIFDNVTMSNSSFACVFVKKADKVIIQNVGTSTITSTYTTGVTDDTSTIDGAIHAKDDLTINGSGTLTVSSKIHGIVCKNDLKVLGEVNLSVTATEKGLDLGDSYRMKGNPVVTVIGGHDGVHVENDEGDSFVYVESGTLNITSTYDGLTCGAEDGITHTGYIKLVGGTLNITSGGGSAKSKNDSISTKGLKCQHDIYIGNINMTIDSSDDAIHSNASISITDGTLTLSSSDDGVHTDSYLLVSGGSTTVKKSYEGFEAYEIEITGGTNSIKSSDDGMNAAGGSDSSSSESNPWGGGGSSSSTGILKISGGYNYVNASGDGIDSNGSMYVSGGTTIVEGPTDSGNGALDKGDGSSYVAQITGGTVLAIGSTGMAINFDSGSQCSGLVKLSGSSGTKISVNDGSGFEFTASKTFACAVYSSPSMSKGNSYTITAGSSSATMSFTSSYIYTQSGIGQGGGGPGGGGGGPGGR